LTVALGLFIAAAGLTACSTPSAAKSSVAVQSPTGTALSWFASINEHDYPLALAHFLPSARDQMEWSDFGTSSFRDVRCHNVSQKSNTSEVECTFSVPNPSPDMENVTFWDVYMKRTPTGPWLITGYGQG
jgi:hypothetical protein